MSGGYPQSAITLECNTFYIFELGFWISCCLYLGFETRRKDFVEMSIHHLSTVCLILFSFLFDFGRPGILVMMIHDVGDIFLYSAKSAQYRKLNKLADVLFAIFALVFYISRWYVFPRFVIIPLLVTIYSGLTDSNFRIVASYNQVPMLVMLTGLLCVLFALHLMWGFTIARMVKRTFTSKTKVSSDGDPRSDDEANDAPISSQNRETSRKKKI